MSSLRIISRSNIPFRNRQEAGRLLGWELAGLRGQKAVVLGIPRGGIVVGREMAQVLEAELDISLSRKLRTPGQPELAMGSVAEDGQMFLNNDVVDMLGVNRAYIEQEKAQQMAEIARRRELMRKFRPRVSLKDRTVIITDDGVATGATMQAAIWSAHQERPSRLIAAVPVGAEETLKRLAGDADEVVCLRAPPFFAAVGQFYIRFDQVEDEDVIAILREEYGKLSKPEDKER
ncbi:MAG: phosphoribosyltransferase [Dehalococcoidales bacterium]|nr:phosphoribosyltransferase [Dehalococcoidales bacterium]